jgi:hypothetical protein
MAVHASNTGELIRDAAQKLWDMQEYEECITILDGLSAQEPEDAQVHGR